MNEDLEIKEYKVQLKFDPESGRIIEECWKNQTNQLDRPNDLPALQRFSPIDGLRTTAGWYKDGNLHRPGSKAAYLVVCPDTNTVLVEHFAFNGFTHRDDGEPSLIIRNAEGRVEEREFRIYGQLHREHGAALERYDPDSGKLLDAQFWEHGKRISTDPEMLPDFN